MRIKGLIIGLIGLCASTAVFKPAASETAKANEYPKTTICLAVDRQTDIVTVADCNGTEWQFRGCQDFEEGDLIALIMSDNGTPETIWDDTVLTTKYSGGTNLFENVYDEKGD